MFALFFYVDLKKNFCTFFLRRLKKKFVCTFFLSRLKKNFALFFYVDLKKNFKEEGLDLDPILSTKRTKLQMATDSKFADFGIIIGRIFNLSTDLKSAWNSLSNHIKHVQIGQVLRKLWPPQFRTLCCWYLG